MGLNSCIKIFGLILRITRLSKMAHKQALDLKLTEHEISFPNLPAEFDGYSVLFMTDFHIDLVQAIEEKILDVVKNTQFDICLFGGDYAYKYKGKRIKITKDFASRLVNSLNDKGIPVIGALGNHDIYDFGLFLESLGVKMLLNESVRIDKNNSHIYISAIDDAYFYKSYDFNLCEEAVSTENSFKILISHTPETYRHAKKHGYSLILCGHTHGGQVCLPGGLPVITHAKTPRRMAKGRWQYGDLHGITSNGIGCSAYAGRFFCPPEIILIKLRKS